MVTVPCNCSRRPEAQPAAAGIGFGEAQGIIAGYVRREGSDGGTGISR